MRRRIVSAAIAGLAAAALAACSSHGGKAAAEKAADRAKGPMTVALITHAAPGDTFAGPRRRPRRIR